ncbi:hypothetical protein DdX_07800 [Ditylenchus destructor]|uniref:Uncharacterized protein n=1 Tax=Ditylenchus destructor TaxID=166010 RepID=A0AAD4N8W1_9BILA|nr:hypothetical protein DdX_07800 [Ditylenchus destructor]
MLSTPDGFRTIGESSNRTNENITSTTAHPVRRRNNSAENNRRMDNQTPQLSIITMNRIPQRLQEHDMGKVRRAFALQLSDTRRISAESGLDIAKIVVQWHSRVRKEHANVEHWIKLAQSRLDNLTNTIRNIEICQRFMSLLPRDVLKHLEGSDANEGESILDQEYASAMSCGSLCSHRTLKAWTPIDRSPIKQNSDDLYTCDSTCTCIEEDGFKGLIALSPRLLSDSSEFSCLGTSHGSSNISTCKSLSLIESSEIETEETSASDTADDSIMTSILSTDE